MLNKKASRIWEKDNLDVVNRTITKDAAINSEGLMYANWNATDKEVENEKKFALKEMIKEIIPIIDTFDVAFKKRIEDEVVKGYVEGFRIIYNKLCNLLKAKQVEIVIPTIGEEYNPTYMEAIQVSEGPENNKVMDVYGKAFILHDVVLRPARVIISKAIKHN